MDYRKMVAARSKKKKKKRQKQIIICVLFLAVLIAAIAVFVSCNKKGDEKNDDNVNDEIAIIQTEEPSLSPTLIPTAEPATEPASEPTSEPVRRGTAEPIPEEIRASMAGKSMPANATVSYDELSYLTIPHYDFDYNVTQGHLVVNSALADEVLDIFADLFDIKYPIERMELIDKYDADDYTSIDYNNTSAFNYRVSTDGTGRLSKHALGRAIDINPQINPYVNSGGRGSHSNASEYWSRDFSQWTSDIAKAAYIGPEAEIYKIFVDKYGWEWGGSWSSYRDYQHFQKTQ